MILDFDSTIAESMECLYENQREWYFGTDLLEYNPQTWESVNQFDAETLDRMWSYFHSDEGIRRVRSKAGAIAAIHMLHAYGFHVYVLTDRDTKSYPALWRWFDTHGIEGGENFVLTITDERLTKQDVVRSIMQANQDNIVAIVDDAPHHLEAYSDIYGDFTVYSFRYPYNTMQIEKGLAVEIRHWIGWGLKVIYEQT